MSDKEKTSRRQFLLGQSAFAAVDEWTDEGSSNVSQSFEKDLNSSKQPAYLIQVSRRAMACEFSVFLNAGENGITTEKAVDALDLVEVLEAQMTVYRNNSEVSLINASAAQTPVKVESLLFLLFLRSVELCDATAGAFDITSGPLSKIWGFHRREGRVPDAESIAAGLEFVGSNLLELDKEKETIFFKNPGLEINLGGIGKGYALDRSAELLCENGVESFLIHGGQSSVAARGRRASGSSETVGWSVGLKHPLRPDRRLAEIYLTDQALSTSGSATQSFRYQGRRFGHILDPRNGQPAEGVLSSTVVAPDAATADALSTAFYVIGVDESLSFCRRHPEIGAILVTEATKSGGLTIRSIGLDDKKWTCFAD